MSFFQDNKLLVCAGVAGVIGAGMIGYFAGKKKYSSFNPLEYSFNIKSHYDAGKTNPVLQYVLKHSLQEPPPIRKLKEATLEYNNRVMMLGAAEEAQFFRLLLPAIKARKAIEIGVYTGYNTLSIAMSIPDDGKVVACDITDKFLNGVNAKSFWEEAGVDHKIDLRLQSAVKTLDELIDNGEADTYDFIFIDADKTNYEIYYEKSLALLRKGGIIAVDNSLWSGKVTADPSSMDEDTLCIHNVNLKIHKDSRVLGILLPFADGVNLAMKL